MNRNLKKLIYAALCLALCMVLPLLTGQIPEIGKRLSSFLFGMPALYPDAVVMAFELATYGAVAGILYRVLPRKPWSVYVALIAAMLAGRLVWGAAKWALLGMSGTLFTLQMFLAGAFINAVPGIILHIVLIPVIVLALEKAGLCENNAEVTT